MRFTLRQLEVFVHTANASSISKAAETLAMSQSAASGALKELEFGVGLQLFDRVGKRLKLNSHGLKARPKIEALLEMAKALEADLQGQTLTPLTVGATLTIGSYLALKMVAQYKETHPEAVIELKIANTQEIARRVANFELDIGLVEGQVNHPELSVTPWYSDELVIFTTPNNRPVKSAALKANQLTQLPWILREPGSGTRQAFEREFSDILPELDIILELDHTEAILQAVLAGLGVSCLSRLALADAFAAKSLIPITVKGRPLKRRCYIVQRKDKYQNEALRYWLNICDEFIRT